MAEYFDIDSTIVRVIMFLLIFAHGAGLIIYLVAWIVMPQKVLQDSPSVTAGSGDNPPPQTQALSPRETNPPKSSSTSSILIGAILIILGLVILAHNMWWWFDWEDYWPVILVAIGALILFRAVGRGNEKETSPREEGVTGESG